MTRASAFGTCFRGWGTAFLDSFSHLTKSLAMAPVVARRRAVIISSFFIHSLLLRLLLSEDGTSERAQFYGQAYWHKMYLTTYRVRYMNSHPRCGPSASAPRAEALFDIVN